MKCRVVCDSHTILMKYVVKLHLLRFRLLALPAIAALAKPPSYTRHPTSLQPVSYRVGYVASCRCSRSNPPEAHVCINTSSPRDPAWFQGGCFPREDSSYPCYVF